MARRHGSFLGMLCILGLMAVGSTANATVIIDTGETENPVDRGWSLECNWSHIQWLAAETTLDQAWTITDIEMWLYEFVPGPMSVVIYGDKGEVPDRGAQLFSTTFFADGPDMLSHTAAWLGPHGLSWDLGPGTYWVAYQVNYNDPTEFAAPNPVPSPLANYAYAWNYNGGWVEADQIDLGLRVSGTPQSVVPEPATLTLSGVGLLGLALGAWRRHKCT